VVRRPLSSLPSDVYFVSRSSVADLRSAILN
jgi:hypothetical protein